MWGQALFDEKEYKILTVKTAVPSQSPEQWSAEVPSGREAVAPISQDCWHLMTFHGGRRLVHGHATSHLLRQDP
jgi:hypothetical protein